jgi:hypothetical protein
MKKKVLAIAAMSTLLATPALAQQPTLEQRLEILQQEVDALKAQGNTAAPSAYGSNSGNTTIGGYGEVVLNNYRDGTVKDEADLKRFILFIGHKFNERLRLFSELEVEHAKVDKNGGEVAMEQAYLEFGLSDKTNARAGLMLMPIGITNETHEPPTFYGVERNEVESRIIPSTWRELGLALQGEAAAGLEYVAGISTTPDASKYKDASKGFRDLRTSGRQAAANDMGVFAALNYRGIPGMLLGASVFSGNTAQDGNGETVKPALADTAARLTLWELHAKYAVGNFDLQALYARGSFTDTEAINSAAGLVAGSDKAAPKSFYGWYAQAAYHVWKDGDYDLAPFVRHERYNTQDAVADGYAKNPLNEETVTTVGMNFSLHPQVVVKADVQNYTADDKKDRINLGIGYMF